MNVTVMSEIQIRGSPGIDLAEPTTLRQTPGAGYPPEAPQQPPEAEPPAEQIEQAAEGLNSLLKSSMSHIQFSVHQESKRMMVEVIDDSTGAVIKTIPSQEFLDLSAKISEMVGVLLDRQG